MLTTLAGLDHVVVMVRELDRAAETWRRLGFTLSPRGTHSEHMGTGNYTIMLGADYIELLGVLRDTPMNAASRAFLQRRGEGIERAAFTTTDAAQGANALRAKGIAATGPVDFSRPVDLPDGRKTEAAFSVFHWPVDERPADMRIFACQHRTRDAVWIPSLQRHANTATRIRRVELIAPQPAEAAAHLARLIDTDVVGARPWRVPSGPGRADFVFASATDFAARYPEATHEALPEQGAAALVLEVVDIEAARRAVPPASVLGASGGTDAAGRICIAGRDANGVMLVFETT